MDGRADEGGAWAQALKEEITETPLDWETVVNLWPAAQHSGLTRCGFRGPPPKSPERCQRRREGIEDGEETEEAMRGAEGPRALRKKHMLGGEWRFALRAITKRRWEAHQDSPTIVSLSTLCPPAHDPHDHQPVTPMTTSQ